MQIYLSYASSMDEDASFFIGVVSIHCEDQSASLVADSVDTFSATDTMMNAVSSFLKKRASQVTQAEAGAHSSEAYNTLNTKTQIFDADTALAKKLFRCVQKVMKCSEEYLSEAEELDQSEYELLSDEKPGASKIDELLEVSFKFDSFNLTPSELLKFAGAEENLQILLSSAVEATDDPRTLLSQGKRPGHRI